MANDALWPGENNTFPHFPRRADGTPYWSDSAHTDGVGIIGRGGVLVAPMPRGKRFVRWRNRRVLVDVTPTIGGDPIDPPTLV